MKIKLIYLIIRIFLIGGLIGAGIYFSEPTETQSIVGSSTLGLQEVNYFTSSSSCFSSEGDSTSSKLWLYTLRGGGLGQWAVGNVDETEVNEVYDGKEKPKENLKIDTRFEQFCEYPIVNNNQATQIYKLTNPIEWSCLSFNSEDAVEKCGSDWKFGGKYGLSITCWCVDKIQKTGAIGSSPNFNNPSTKTDMTIKVEAKGQSYEKTLSSDEQIRGKVGNNVCAIWQGNAVTGSVCGLPSDDLIPAYISGNWKLLSKDIYDTYKTNWDVALNTLKSSGGSKTEIKNAINNLNSKSDNAFNSRVSFGTIDEPTSLVNAKISKELTSLNQYPILSLYVRADWLGVVTPIPDPKITEISSQCFGSGDAGRIKVVVENRGDERGEVDLYGICDSGFEVERKSISLSAKGDLGDEKTIYLDISGTTEQEELTGSCRVYADAIENIDESTVDVCITGHPSCSLEEEWCEDSNLWFCPNVIQPTLKEDCKSQGLTCEYTTDGIPFCAESSNYCNDNPDDPKCLGTSCGCWISIPKTKFWDEKCILPDLWCHINNFISKFRLIFAIVVGALGGLIAGSYVYIFVKKQKSKIKWIVIISSIIILGVAIGYTSFIYFWWIVLTLIILGIIRAFIPGI